MEDGHPGLMVVLALAIGIVAQSLARHLKVPSIVLLLLAGSALGPDGLDWIRTAEIGDGLFAIVDLAVAVILFEGGLNLEVGRLRRSQAPIRRLVTWGALVTLVGAAASVHWALAWPWLRSLLFGSLVVVTGPTVVGPLIRELRLRTRPATVLEAEGVMIDPIGAILAVLMLEITLTPGTESMAAETTNLVFRVGFGALAGVAAGFAIASMLRVKRLIPEGHENVFVLAAVLLLSQGCDAAFSHSGILAVTVAGIVVGNLPTPVDRDLREFKDQLTTLFIGLLFILLAADVRLSDVKALGWPGLAVVACLILVVRPLTVALATARSDLTWRERALIGWVAPRGIVAAAVASLAAVSLDRDGLGGGSELRALVFLTIAGTVFLAGFTARPMAALLRQRLPGRDVTAILGSDGLGFLLGQELRASGANVLFLDSNSENCRRAQEAGFAVIFGDAIQERTLQRARFELVRDAVGATSNQMLNSLFVRRARERFGVPRGFVSAVRPETGITSELVERERAVVLFDGPHDALRWEVRTRHRGVEIEKWVYGGESHIDRSPAPREDVTRSALEPYVMLAVRRGARMFPMHVGLVLRVGDVASIAVHTPDADAAHLALTRRGWSRQREGDPEAG